MENETTKAGLDRRKLIKRAGIITGGVVVWSTPGVTSLASAAHAAGSSPSNCTSCGSFAVCSNSGPLGTCNCFEIQGQPGSCTCGENEFCSNLTVCSSQADCPAGTTCISANNGCGQPVCIVNCDNTTGARRAPQKGSGPTAAPVS